MSTGDKLRKSAASYGKKADELLSKSLNGRAWTRKRGEEIDYAHREGKRLKVLQIKMQNLAALQDNDQGGLLQEVRDGKACNYLHSYLTWPKNNIDATDSFKRNGIWSDTYAEARRAWDALPSEDADSLRAKRLAELDAINREGLRLAGAVPGFWPTPYAVGTLMTQLANEYMSLPSQAAVGPIRLLEPSAGVGNLVDVMLEAWPGREIYAVEHNWSLVELLRRKYAGSDYVQVVNQDFLTTDKSLFPPMMISGNGVDVILMNPPFEKMADIDHVLHAYRMLNAGGVLVAVMSKSWTFRTDRKASEFRETFAELELEGAAEWRDLPDNSFKESGTGVSAGLLVLSK